MSRKVLDENQRLGEAALRNTYPDSPAPRSSKSHQREGDIFDSMFERQKHWKNFYSNIMQQHQLANISKHQTSYLQKEVMKQHDLDKLIMNGVADKSVQDQHVLHRLTRAKLQVPSLHAGQLGLPAQPHRDLQKPPRPARPRTRLQEAAHARAGGRPTRGQRRPQAAAGRAPAEQARRPAALQTGAAVAGTGF